MHIVRTVNGNAEILWSAIQLTDLTPLHASCTLLEQQMAMLKYCGVQFNELISLRCRHHVQRWKIAVQACVEMIKARKEKTKQSE
jgi:hypothetical protein